MVVDVTLRSVLTCNGEHHPHATNVDGAVLVAIRRDKEAMCSEIGASGQCKFVLVGIETEGKLNEEGVVLMRFHSKAKARETPTHFMRSPSLAWERRWTWFLQNPVAKCESACHMGGVLPLLADFKDEDPRA